MPVPVSLAALENALSAERLEPYRLGSDSDRLDGVARYLWNMALASAIQPAIHILEVTFRNHLYDGSAKLFATRRWSSRSGACWLDAVPELLLPNEAERVRDTKLGLRRGHPTSGQLIAALDFGFWVSLCRRPYEQGRHDGPRLWPELLRHAFRHAPTTERSRERLYQRFDELRKFRNRVSHHEPIWNRDPLGHHERLVEAVGWMNPSVAALLHVASPFIDVHEAGIEPYRERTRSWFKDST